MSALGQKRTLRNTHFWVCPKCGNEFTTSFFLCPDQPLVPEIIETFLPNLLVA
jgi:hypothetical protein